MLNSSAEDAAAIALAKFYVGNDTIAEDWPEWKRSADAVFGNDGALDLINKPKYAILFGGREYYSTTENTLLERYLRVFEFGRIYDFSHTYTISDFVFNEHTKNGNNVNVDITFKLTGIDVSNATMVEVGFKTNLNNNVLQDGFYSSYAEIVREDNSATVHMVGVIYDNDNIITASSNITVQFFFKKTNDMVYGCSFVINRLTGTTPQVVART